MTSDNRHVIAMSVEEMKSMDEQNFHFFMKKMTMHNIPSSQREAQKKKVIETNRKRARLAKKARKANQKANRGMR